MNIKKFKTEPEKKHCDDKIRQCKNCGLFILIPFNIVGGAWHLNNYEDKNGIKHFGCYCQECFDELK